MAGDGILVARVGDIGDGEALQVSRDRVGTIDDVAIFHDGAQYYALDDTCTHEKASLSEGWIEDGVIECPLHAGKFCLKNGAVLSMPATDAVACHRVVVDGDAIRLIPNPLRLAP